MVLRMYLNTVARMVSSADILEDVTRDISYLLKQINDLSRMESEATSEIPLTSDEVGAAAECGTEQKRVHKCGVCHQQS